MWIAGRSLMIPGVNSLSLFSTHYTYATRRPRFRNILPDPPRYRNPLISGESRTLTRYTNQSCHQVCNLADLRHSVCVASSISKNTTTDLGQGFNNKHSVAHETGVCYPGVVFRVGVLSILKHKNGKIAYSACRSRQQQTLGSCDLAQCLINWSPVGKSDILRNRHGILCGVSVLGLGLPSQLTHQTSFWLNRHLYLARGVPTHRVRSRHHPRVEMQVLLDLVVGIWINEDGCSNPASTYES